MSLYFDVYIYYFWEQILVQYVHNWPFILSLTLMKPHGHNHRYDMASNRWKKETSIPKRLTDEPSVGFVTLNGELHVISSIQHKRSASLFLQIYHPQKMTWRTLITKTPFHKPLNFKTKVMCTIRL